MTSYRVVAFVTQVIAYLYGLEFGVALVLFGLYKTPHYDLTTLSTPAGIIIVVGMSIISTMAWQLLRLPNLTARTFAIGVTTNVLSLALAFVASEIALRTIAVETDDGISIGTIALLPTWSETVARNRVIVEPSSSTHRDSYFVYDPDLGWTVGPNRRSANGYYFSSAEGIRSPSIGIHYAQEAIRPRVALIGDSNAFSLEVPFRDSLGNHLQTILGAAVQVLNFGVDGYGIDQIYLKYQRDVRPWKPEVVLVVFIEHDLMRSM